MTEESQETLHFIQSYSEESHSEERSDKESES
jgi:hypothetical protein